MNSPAPKPPPISIFEVAESFIYVFAVDWATGLITGLRVVMLAERMSPGSTTAKGRANV